MKLIFGLLFFVFAIASPITAQQLDWGIEASPKAGFLLAHRGVMGHLPEEHALGGELTCFIQTTGKNPYHQRYNFPKIGITLFGSTVGNNKLLGQVYGAYSFIDFPFAKSKRMEFSGRVGCGLSWITKVFDQELNPKDVAMSTHINALLCLGLRYRYFMGRTHIVAGIDLTHCSNGSTRVPNLGINLPYVSLGVGYSFNPMEKIYTEETFQRKRWNISAIGIFSVKEIFPTGGKLYPIYALSIVGKKIFTPKSGIEVAYDLIYKTSILGYKPEIKKTKASITQMGVYCGYVMPLNKLSFVVGMGVYLMDKYNPDDLFYHRVGMRYQLAKNILINLTLKTHWAKADYVEYGIGYTF